MGDLNNLMSKLRQLKTPESNPADILKSKLQLPPVIIKKHVKIDQFDVFTNGVPIKPKRDGSNPVYRFCPHIKSPDRKSHLYRCTWLKHLNEFVFGSLYYINGIMYTTKHADLLGCNGCPEKLKNVLFTTKS